ncbi:hypothetical protein Tco_1045341 [Tanacetum coccineum]|uniref:Uncharacterized protein n=1 Tax=Tanacetum coccineum TaxID=301880 RepID=A0ABQ5GSH7_9ASTR
MAMKDHIRAASSDHRRIRILMKSPSDTKAEYVRARARGKSSKRKSCTGSKLRRRKHCLLVAAKADAAHDAFESNTDIRFEELAQDLARDNNNESSSGEEEVGVSVSVPATGEGVVICDLGGWVRIVCSGTVGDSGVVSVGSCGGRARGVLRKTLSRTKEKGFLSWSSATTSLTSLVSVWACSLKHVIGVVAEPSLTIALKQ